MISVYSVFIYFAETNYGNLKFFSSEQGHGQKSTYIVSCEIGKTHVQTRKNTCHCILKHHISNKNKMKILVMSKKRTRR